MIPGERRAEAGVHKRKLPEAPGAHAPAMAIRLDDAAQGGIQRVMAGDLGGRVNATEAF